MLGRDMAASKFGVLRFETRRGRKRPYLDFRIDGERFRIRKIPVEGGLTVPLEDEAIAARLLEALRERVRAGTSPRAALAPFLGARSPLALEPAWARFVAAKRRQAGLSAKRVNELASYPGRGYFEPLAGMPAFAIRYVDLEDLRDWLAEARGLAPKSVRHVIADLGTFLTWLENRGEIDRRPNLPEVRVPDHVPRIPSPEQMERILSAIPAPARGLFLARGWMGLRPSEARRARVGDYDPETRMLTVRGKGGRVRMLPADDQVAEWIAENVPRGFGAEPLFRNPATGQAWSVSASRRAWAAASRAAGAVDDDGRPLFRENEGLRHAFGTAAVNRGVTLDRTGAYMGHADPKTTRRYAKLAAVTLGDVVRHGRNKRS